MQPRKIDLIEADARFAELDAYVEELAFAREQLRENIERYRFNPNPQSRAALLSSLAFFDNHVKPAIAYGEAEQKRFIAPFRHMIIVVDKDWRSYEFDQLFRGIDYFHKLFVIREKLFSDVPEMRISQGMTRAPIFQRSLLHFYLAPHEELQVRRIRYGSKGAIDFEGMAAVIAQVRETIDYIFTFQFVKSFVDLYDHFQYERPAERAEKRMRLREVLRQEEQQERRAAYQDLEEYHRFLCKMKDIAEVTEQLDKRNLAIGHTVEQNMMRAMSTLHRLGFEQTKAGVLSPLADSPKGEDGAQSSP
jgi:hypothetical protein